MAPTRSSTRGDEYAPRARYVDYHRRIDQRSGRIQKPLPPPVSPRIIDIQKDDGFGSSAVSRPNLNKGKGPELSRNFVRSGSTHATFLPFGTQHILLGVIQTLLEEACFYWNKKWLPIVLHTKGWDTPEAGELNQWWGAMRNYRIPPRSTNVPMGFSLNTLFVRIHQIRHAAVHRLRYSYDSLKRMVSDSLLLADALQDDARASKIRAIQNALCMRDVEALEAVVKKPLEKICSTALQDATNGGRREPVNISAKVEHANITVENQRPTVVSAHTRLVHNKSPGHSSINVRTRLEQSENRRPSSNILTRVKQFLLAAEHENQHALVTKGLGKSPLKRSKQTSTAVFIDLTGDEKDIPPPRASPSSSPLPPPPTIPKVKTSIIDLTGA